MKKLVIIPTYNERDNIANLIQDVFARNLDVDILVVDDNSPDGTGEIIKELKHKLYRLHLLSRSGKQGLAKAYLAGFEWGLHEGYDAIVEMDADFSHRPQDLDKILAALKSKDFVVGSRYVTGGSTENWGLARRIISQGGSFYARTILGFPIRDWTGGFNGWTRKVLEGISLDQVSSQGYSFQIELKYRASKKGFRGEEVPILFEDRRVGQSKMSLSIVIEAFWRVWLIKWSCR